MRDVLRSAVFLGRSLASDLLLRTSQRLRPREEKKPEWLTQVIADIAQEQTRRPSAHGALFPDHVYPGKKPGDVTLSPKAQRMVDQANTLEVAPEREDPHAPPEPLRGSLAWRQRYGDSR